MDLLQGAHSRVSKMIGWEAPKPGWIKTNHNGAHNTAFGSATESGVLRDSQGKWLHGFSFSIARKLFYC